MMGGGGGGGYLGPAPEHVQKKVDDSLAKELERLVTDVDGLLERLLARFNSRNVKLTQRRLDGMRKILENMAELEAVLFGGSVAKHTEIDGLSDVDALVVLDRADLAGKGPRAVLNAFERILSDRLHRAEVASIEKGRLAVTVKYKDGTEIQLLPALRSGKITKIPGTDGKSWNDTRPTQFTKQLSDANKRMSQQLVPTIKLFKSIIAGLPEQKRISGYHAEALALDAVRSYGGPRTPRALLLHVLDHAGKRVNRPLADPTGQSRTMDKSLGKEGSVARRNVSQALLGVKRRLDAARTLGEWKSVFEE